MAQDSWELIADLAGKAVRIDSANPTTNYLTQELRVEELVSPAGEVRTLFEASLLKQYSKGARFYDVLLQLYNSGGLGSGFTKRMRRLATTFDPNTVTWDDSQKGQRWNTPGGDIIDHPETNIDGIPDHTGGFVTIDMTALANWSMQWNQGLMRWIYVGNLIGTAWVDRYNLNAKNASRKPHLLCTVSELLEDDWDLGIARGSPAARTLAQ